MRVEAVLNADVSWPLYNSIDMYLNSLWQKVASDSGHGTEDGVLQLRAGMRRGAGRLPDARENPVETLPALKLAREAKERGQRHGARDGVGKWLGRICAGRVCGLCPCTVSSAKAELR